MYVVNADGTGLTAIASGANPDWFTSLPGQPVAAFTYECSGVTCDFDAAGSFDPDGTIASYLWHFGDGTGDSGPTAHHAYATGNQHGVSLTVTDNSGATGSVMVGVRANTAPVASFTVACSGPTCTFDGSGSSDPDGTIASYSWSFGDGQSGAGATVNHTYATGTFSATLIVADSGGATGTALQTLTVVNAPPVATFTSTCNGLTCTFDGSGSSDPDGTITVLLLVVLRWVENHRGSPGRGRELHVRRGRHLHGHADRHRQQRLHRHRARDAERRGRHVHVRVQRTHAPSTGRARRSLVGRSRSTSGRSAMGRQPWARSRVTRSPPAPIRSP